MIIAIDGPAAAGKGTLARRLAAHFDFAFLDTGLLYRAVGHRVQTLGGDPADADAAIRAAGEIGADDLANPALRDEAVSKASSVVSTIEGVRTALLDFQRQFAAHPPDGKRGAVLDGRDIGTVVCPDADVKIFLTASPEARADRRHKELLGKGVVSIYSRVLADVKERDLRDGRRKVAPMVRAEDAFVLDSTGLDVDAVFAAALEFVAARTADR